MKTFYILENNYSIDFFENEADAIKAYNYYFERLTESEKNKLDYFRLYSVKSENLESLKNSDPMDCVENMILCYK